MPKIPTQVKTYKNAGDYQHDVKRMSRQGWSVAGTVTNKKHHMLKKDEQEIIVTYQKVNALPQSSLPPQRAIESKPLTPAQRKRALTFILSFTGATMLVILIAIIAFAVSLSKQPSSSNTQQATTSTATSQSTTAPTTQPTTASSANGVTNGTPHIGGPMSDFYGKYGQPNNQGIGTSETWIVDQQQTVLVNATPDANAQVAGVSVTTGANWSNTQMQQYCSQFLPADASAFNSVSDLTDYHSSIGEVVMQLGASMCVLSLAQS